MAKTRGAESIWARTSEKAPCPHSWAITQMPVHTTPCASLREANEGNVKTHLTGSHGVRSGSRRARRRRVMSQSGCPHATAAKGQQLLRPPSAPVGAPQRGVDESDGVLVYLLAQEEEHGCHHEVHRLAQRRKGGSV